jgi:fructoselysine-6-P-deglycase FrlB-like protein
MPLRSLKTRLDFVKIEKRMINQAVATTGCGTSKHGWWFATAFFAILW